MISCQGRIARKLKRTQSITRSVIQNPINCRSIHNLNSQNTLNILDSDESSHFGQQVSEEERRDDHWMFIGSGVELLRMSSNELCGSISSCHNGSWSPGQKFLVTPSEFICQIQKTLFKNKTCKQITEIPIGREREILQQRCEQHHRWHRHVQLLGKLLSQLVAASHEKKNIEIYRMKNNVRCLGQVLVKYIPRLLPWSSLLSMPDQRIHRDNWSQILMKHSGESNLLKLYYL